MLFDLSGFSLDLSVYTSSVLFIIGLSVAVGLSIYTYFFVSFYTSFISIHLSVF